MRVDFRVKAAFSSQLAIQLCCSKKFMLLSNELNVNINTLFGHFNTFSGVPGHVGNLQIFNFLYRIIF